MMHTLVELDKLKFTFATFTFHILARERMHLPEYKGSAFRGGFGYVMKKVCCVMPTGSCQENCQMPESCPYAYIFETPQTRTYHAPIQSTNLPHPFVILPPLTTEEIIHAGKTLSFRLTLIGKGIEYLPFFIFAFDELGRSGIGRGRGRYQLDRVTDGFSHHEIYSGLTQTLTGDFKIRHFADLVKEGEQWDKNSITLQFITPTRILDQNKLVDKLSFELLMRNLLRRASLLARVHCEQVWDLDYGAILDYACTHVKVAGSELHWQDWERYSTRQKRRMKLGGFVGEVTYEGELTPLLPLIHLGQYIHLGKNTSFGMGKYRVNFEVSNPKEQNTNKGP
jgi:CRISPR-associated endoribonuclease Cas6